MQLSKPSTDRGNAAFRYAALAFLFCVVAAAALLQAKYRLLSAQELALYGATQATSIMMRLPLVVGFCVMLALALLAAERALERRIGVAGFVAGALLLGAGVGLQQAKSLRRLQLERKAFFTAVNRLEKAAASGERVVFEDGKLGTVFGWYGSVALRAELGTQPGSGEWIYVGTENGPTGQQLAAEGFTLRRDASRQEFQLGQARLYFVTRYTPQEPTTAVSSKP